MNIDEAREFVRLYDKKEKLKDNISFLKGISVQEVILAFGKTPPYPHLHLECRDVTKQKVKKFIIETLGQELKELG